MRQLFNQLMGKKPTMLTPSQMAMQELSGGMQQAWDGMDTPPKLIDKKAGEKSLAPVRDRGLTVGEQRRLREQGRPDLADAQYDSSGKQWVLPTNESMDASRIDPSRVNASDGQGWVRATPPNAADKNTLIDAMSPETRAVAPVPTWQDFMARNPQLGTPEGQKFLDRHPGIDGGARMPDTGGLIKGADPVFDIGGQTAPRGALGMDTGGGMGSMAMGALGGASGALDGIMSDAQNNVGGGIKDNFDSRNPIRDATLARARSGQAVPMRGLRYGGYVAPGEEVLVGEVAPEKVIARPEGGVEVVPLDAPQAMADDPFTAQERGMMDAPRMSNPERSIGAYDGVGYGTPAYGGDGSQRPVGTEAASGISDITIDEGPAPPPRRSLLDTKRIIARNNDGLTDEGVWQAREDVLKEDQWRALNEPVKKSKWKDIGMMLLTSLNNQVNNRQDPVRTWGEIKRDEKMGNLAPQVQLVQQRKAEQAMQAKAQQEARVRESQAIENEAQAAKQYADIEAQRRKDALEGKKWTETKINGKIYKKLSDGTLEPLIIDGVHQRELKDTPITRRLSDGTEVSVTNSQALSSDDARVAAQATKDQQAMIHNSNKEFDREKTNVSNTLKHQDDTRAVMTQIASANANILQGNAKAQAANQRIQAANAAAQAAAQAGNGEAFTAAQDEFNKASADFAAAIGEVQGGDAAAKQLQKLLTQAPPRVSFKPIESVKIGGKVARSSDIDAFAATKGWTRKQAENYLKGKGYTIQ